MTLDIWTISKFAGQILIKVSKETNFERMSRLEEQTNLNTSNRQAATSLMSTRKFFIIYCLVKKVIFCGFLNIYIYI